MTDAEIQAACRRLKMPRFMWDTEACRDALRAFHAEGIAAAVAAERERCAKLCEQTGEAAAETYGDGAECLTTAAWCAEAIRNTKAQP